MSGCSALAYSASAVIAATAATDSGGQGDEAASTSGGGGGGVLVSAVGNVGEIARRRFLGKVVTALRRAAGQAGVGEKVSEVKV